MWSSILSDAVLEGVQELFQQSSKTGKIIYKKVRVWKVNHFVWYLGFSRVQLTQKNGARWSSDKSLKENRFLTVLTNAHVHKVWFLTFIFHFSFSYFTVSGDIQALESERSYIREVWEENASVCEKRRYFERRSYWNAKNFIAIWGWAEKWPWKIWGNYDEIGFHK